jgi:hypothetical protein
VGVSALDSVGNCYYDGRMHARSNAATTLTNTTFSRDFEMALDESALSSAIIFLPVEVNIMKHL